MQFLPSLGIIAGGLVQGYAVYKYGQARSNINLAKIFKEKNEFKDLVNSQQIEYFPIDKQAIREWRNIALKPEQVIQNSQQAQRYACAIYVIGKGVVTLPLLGACLANSSVLGLMGTRIVTVTILTPFVHELAKAMAEELRSKKLSDFLKHFDRYSSLQLNVSIALWLGLCAYNHQHFTAAIQAMGWIGLKLVASTQSANLQMRKIFQSTLEDKSRDYKSSRNSEIFDAKNNEKILNALDFSNKGIIRQNDFAWVFSKIQTITAKIDEMIQLAKAHDEHEISDTLEVKRNEIIQLCDNFIDEASQHLNIESTFDFVVAAHKLRNGKTG